MSRPKLSQPAEIDAIEIALNSHQMQATLTDACTCGAGDITILRPTGVALRMHRRHVAEEIAKRVNTDRILEQVAQAIEAQSKPGDKWWDAVPDEMRGVIGAWVASSARIAREAR